jgi:hypothetical protein
MPMMNTEGRMTGQRAEVPDIRPSMEQALVHMQEQLDQAGEAPDPLLHWLAEPGTEVIASGFTEGVPWVVFGGAGGQRLGWAWECYSAPGHGHTDPDEAPLAFEEYLDTGGLSTAGAKGIRWLLPANRSAQPLPWAAAMNADDPERRMEE